MAYLVPDYHIVDDGLLQFTVSIGGIEDFSYSEESGFHGKYFSKRQIDRHLTLRENDLFNYSMLYDDLLTLNRNPDLVVDTFLKVHTDPTTKARMANITLTPRETIPLHGGLQIGNYGTEQTDRERFHAFFEYHNLTKHHDSLYVHYSSGSQRSDYESISGNYTIRSGFREKWSFRLFGGFSETAVSNVSLGNVSIDLEGEEEFYGFQFLYQFLDSDRYRLSLTAGRIWRDTRDEFEENDDPSTGRSSTIRVAPFDLNINFSEQQFGHFLGRNFLGLTVASNWSALDGTSSQSVFDISDLEADYWLMRGYFIRHQQIGSTGFLVSLRTNGQYSEDNLVSSEQKSMGGVFSVRGYEQDRFLSDKGINASVEVYSPPLSKIMGASKISTPFAFDIKALIFYDYGYFRDTSDPSGLTIEDELKSGGCGIRLDVDNAFDLQLDYAWPFEPVNGSNASGRAHVQASMRF